MSGRQKKKLKIEHITEICIRNVPSSSKINYNLFTLACRIGWQSEKTIFFHKETVQKKMVIPPGIINSPTWSLPIDEKGYRWEK
jgi:hypothetical protein